MSVFDRVIGQDAAVTLLERFVAAPTHAYLFTGPAGSGKLDAALCFAAALQCPDGGCGVCERCRTIVSGNDPDVAVVRRVGLSWSKDEIADIERLARRKPLLGGRQIVIMTALEHAGDMRAKLLKVLEEPPTATLFILLADDTPDEFTTIASRCAEVPFTTLRVDDLVRIVQRDGHDEIAARIAAEAAGGDLDRARLLLEDDGVTARMEFWRHVPTSLSVRSPADLAHDIGAQIELAMQPLYAAQEAEMEQLRDEAEMLGRRGIVNRDEVVKRHKREQRRYRTDDILFGFAVLARTYRERLVGALEALDEGDRRSRHEAKGSAQAVDELGRAADALRGNADADFLLTTLFTTLAGL